VILLSKQNFELSNEIALLLEAQAEDRRRHTANLVQAEAKLLTSLCEQRAHTAALHKLELDGVQA